jgi:ACS family tartrate transporter-like MFS transporter
MINSFGNLGGFVGPYVTGAVGQATGSYAGAMLYLSASLAAAGLLILTLPDDGEIGSGRISVSAIATIGHGGSGRN